MCESDLPLNSEMQQRLRELYVVLCQELVVRAGGVCTCALMKDCLDGIGQRVNHL